MMDELARKTAAVMRSVLTSYEAPVDVGSLDLLVGQLSGAIDSLVGKVNDGWLDDLRSAWWPLEYVNASVLGDDRGQLTASEVEAVSAARDEFLSLLDEY